MQALETVLERSFGMRAFRPGQKQVIEEVLQGRDVLAQWPTGFGKSLAYQLPALVLPHATLVVSPLLALMQDQVDRLRGLGIPGVSSISAHRTPEENQRTLEALQRGEARVVFIAPERFSSPGFLEALQGLPLSLMAVDEAHCITQWGHDFRPDYLRLGEAVEALRPRSVLALTASATPAVRQQIVRRLAMRQPKLFVAPLDRPNLRLEAVETHAQQKADVLLSQLGKSGALPAVVYTGRRREAEQVAELLLEHGVLADSYHAGLPADRRRVAQDRFLAGEVAVMAATVAFGMGIDKADVRTVVHWQPPASLEAYYQEAGRAGRDGQPARCVLLHSRSDFVTLRTFARRRYPELDELDALHAGLGSRPPLDLRSDFRSWSPECWRLSLNALLGRGFDPAAIPPRKVSARAAWLYLESLRRAEVDRLDEMERYARTGGCRRRVLLGWFGEETGGSCGQCDRCRPRPGQALLRPGT